MIVYRAQKWPEERLLPKRQWHRGGSLGLPENTLQAFREAKRLGAEMVELDVRVSFDGTPYVCHDIDLKRVFSLDINVEESSDKEIEELNVISTLKKVLLARDIPDFLNIEVKSEKLFDKVRAERVAKVIRDYGDEKVILFSSFNPMVLFYLAKLLPEVPRALLIGGTEKMPWILRSPLWTYVAKAHLVHLEHTLCSQQVVNHWRNRGYKLAAWTVNDSSRESELFDMGLDSVISDLTNPV